MTNFQFTLIMKTLLAILHLKLNDWRNPEAWEKAEKEYDDLKGLFSLWQSVQKDEF